MNFIKGLPRTPMDPDDDSVIVKHEGFGILYENARKSLFKVTGGSFEMSIYQNKFKFLSNFLDVLSMRYLRFSGCQRLHNIYIDLIFFHLHSQLKMDART